MRKTKKMPVPKWIYTAAAPRGFQRGGGAHYDATAEMAEWTSFIVRPYYASVPGRLQARSGNKDLEVGDELILAFTDPGNTQLVGRFGLVAADNPGLAAVGQITPFVFAQNPNIPSCFGRIQDLALLGDTEYEPDPVLGFHTALCVEQLEDPGLTNQQFQEIRTYVGKDRGALKRWDQTVERWELATGQTYPG